MKVGVRSGRTVAEVLLCVGRISVSACVVVSGYATSTGADASPVHIHVASQPTRDHKRVRAHPVGR